MEELSPSQFLKRIWPEPLLTHETLELRMIRRSDQTIKREFLTSLTDFLSRAKEYPDYEIYFGVSTRFRNGGKKRDCYRVKASWADLDGRKLEEVKHLTPLPDLIVDSGGGCHAYWLFHRPILVKDGHGSKVEAENRYWCDQFKADIAAIDVSRILRVPGFLNHKYNPPRIVRAWSYAS